MGFDENKNENNNAYTQTNETYDINLTETNSDNKNDGNNPFGNNNRTSFNVIMPRSIALCIILTIVTCGLYSLYWIAVLNDEINQIAGDHNETSGALVVILSIVTCGIYELFWLYKMGNKIDDINGTPNGNTGILYLILGFLISIVAFALMQDFINKRVTL